MELELISIKEAPKEFKIELLRALGLDADNDGIYVIGKDGKRVLDKYINEPIKLSNMVILPGSTIVLDDNPISIAGYMDEFGEI
jgi:hypothetical protein